MNRYNCILEFPAKSPLKKRAGWRYYCVKTSDPGQHHLCIGSITLSLPGQKGRKEVKLQNVRQAVVEERQQWDI